MNPTTAEHAEAFASNLQDHQDATAATVDYAKAPEPETLIEWMEDGGCETPDGCWVEPDGHCEHGQKSWLLIMGLI